MRNFYAKIFGKHSLATVLVCVLLCTAVTAEIKSFAAHGGELVKGDGERIVLWSSLFGGFDGGSVEDCTVERNDTYGVTSSEAAEEVHKNGGRTVIKFRIVEIFRK